MFLYSALTCHRPEWHLFKQALQDIMCFYARVCVCVAFGVWAYLAVERAMRARCVIEMSCVQERSLTEREPLAMPQRACDRWATASPMRSGIPQDHSSLLRPPPSSVSSPWAPLLSHSLRFPPCLSAVEQWLTTAPGACWNIKINGRLNQGLKECQCIHHFYLRLNYCVIDGGSELAIQL